MNVLVTGSSGFIGSRVAASYADLGNTVLGLDVRTVHHIGFEQRECDLFGLDIRELMASFKPDIVIHCAGNANVSLSVENPEMDFQLGVHLLHRLMFGIKASGNTPRVVFLSSAAVYGNPSILPISESTPVRPISPYGLHKWQCEQICEYFHRSEGIPAISARIFSAYGAGLRKQVFWDLAGKLMKRGRVELFGTGEESRDFIHVDDLVSSIQLIATHGDKPVFNVGNGLEYTIRQVSQLLSKGLGRTESEVEFNGNVRAGDPLNWRADISELSRIGYCQKVSLEDGLGAFAKWVLDGAH